MSDAPAFEAGEWVVDKQDPDREPAVVINPDRGRADGVRVGTTGRTVADFEGNEPYSQSDRVVSIIFRSELESKGVGPSEVPRDDPVPFISSHEAVWSVTMRRYDYPEPRLAPRDDRPEGESG